jgi:hypothetical protein
MTARTEAEERARWFEVWQKVDGGVNDASPWMVWEVGPDTGGEHWFTTESEARAYIAARVSEKSRAA